VSEITDPDLAATTEPLVPEQPADYGEEPLYAGDLYPEADITPPQYANDTGKLKTLPHSAEAERSLLGGMMLSHEAWDAVADIVTSQDFYFQKHTHIFKELSVLAEAAEPLDVVTLSGALEKNGTLEAAGGLSYLVELVKNTPSAANIRAYAKIVHDRAKLRRIIKTATEIQNTAFNPEGRDAGDVLDSAERLIMQVGENGPKQGGPIGANELLGEALGKIDELFQFLIREDKDHAKRIRSYMKDNDISVESER